MAAPAAGAVLVTRLANLGSKIVTALSGSRAAYAVGGYTLGNMFDGEDAPKQIGGVVIGLAIAVALLVGYLAYRGVQAVKK